MNVTLTDHLCCPRCGPRFGLVLLADRVVERRVLEGRLGCPNCRERYPVVAGRADLRPPPRAAPPPAQGARGDVREAGQADGDAAGAGSAAPEGLDAVAALLGVARGPGTVLLLGSEAGLAPALAERLEDVEVAAARRAPPLPGGDAVSPLLAGAPLPFRDGSMRGVALAADEAAWIEEAARVVARGARVALRRGGGALGRSLEAAGLEVVFEDGEAVAAVRP